MADAHTLSDARFEPCNLDDYSTDPAELDALAEVYKDLQRCATLKAQAMRLRLSGRNQVAITFETEAEKVYKRLPAWARW